MSSRAFSPALSISSLDKHRDLKIVVEFFRTTYFFSMITLPIPWGVEMVSHPLIACRNKRPSDRGGSSFFLRVVMQTVFFAVTMYRLLTETTEGSELCD